MKKLILIILAISFYPFGCEGQVNGTLIGSDGCDTVYIEGPQIEALNNGMKACQEMVERLTEENAILTENNQSLTASLATATTTIAAQKKTISNLNQDKKDLQVLLDDCLARPTDTVYVNVEVVKPMDIDTILISHCADSTKNTTWFHWGGVSGYPHPISMASKELGMVKIMFKDSLTDEIKVQKQYKLKRIRDYQNAATSYEFVE